MIEIRGLTQRYSRNRLALDHLDLHVNPGEILGLIGPNGAGKTTTIRVLATLLTPTAGTVRLADLDVLRDKEAVRWRIGYLSDSFGVYEEMRVQQFLEFFAAVYRIAPKKREQLVADLLELVDLRHLAREPVRNLSRGTQQRLGLARVLVHDPDVLLLDEPASGLDPRARVEVREFLKELRRLGKTVLISSHILADLADVCDQLAIIDRGQLQFHGSLDDLRKQGGEQIMVSVDVDSDPEQAASRLQAHPGVVEVQRNERALSAVLQNQQVGHSALLRWLLEGGVEVRSFRVAEPNLEAAFLAMTRPADPAQEDADHRDETIEDDAAIADQDGDRRTQRRTTTP